MSHQSYSNRVYNCLVLGRCHSYMSKVESPKDLNTKRLPQSIDPFALYTTKQLKETACFPCRMIGSVLFLGTSTYSWYVFSLSLRGSGDRRLSAALGISFGILGVYRALKS